MILNIFNFAEINIIRMIQRLQTLYLLIADLLIGLLFFIPFAEIAGLEGKLFLFYLSGIVSEGGSNGIIEQKSWPLFVLAIIAMVLLTLTIFQYKKRTCQIRISYITVFLLLGLFSSIYFSTWKCNQILGGTYSMKISFTFPLIAAVFVYLAIRGIAKDEHLVKSIDRIR